MNIKKSLIAGLSVSVLFLGTLLFSEALTANPTGGAVVSGSASIVQEDPHYTEIQQHTPRTILEWEDFSIGAQERTHFAQPDGGIALNRITGQNPSDILGQLTATGRIVLVNPAGIFFGPGSRVDVGGLIATTADIRNQDFLNAFYRFQSLDGAVPATVVNKGLIRVADYGLAALLAPGVENHGVIEANLGAVVLGAGKAFSLDLHGDALIHFQVDVAADATAVGSDGQRLPHLIQQSGTIMADGGKVLITGRAASDVVDRIIVSDGYVQARSHNGEIVLDGGETGSVDVLGGSLDASNYESDGQGGVIQVLGNRVALKVIIPIGL